MDDGLVGVRRKDLSAQPLGRPFGPRRFRVLEIRQFGFFVGKKSFDGFASRVIERRPQESTEMLNVEFSDFAWRCELVSHIHLFAC
ncbi:MAG: hypothetical protein P4L68_05225 [Methylovirgula sp.]|nr:hypothetical protein [Methylovirgula sp.]